MHCPLLKNFLNQSALKLGFLRSQIEFSSRTSRPSLPVVHNVLILGGLIPTTYSASSDHFSNVASRYAVDFVTIQCPPLIYMKQKIKLFFVTLHLWNSIGLNLALH